MFLICSSTHLYSFAKKFCIPIFAGWCLGHQCLYTLVASSLSSSAGRTSRNLFGSRNENTNNDNIKLGILLMSSRTSFSNSMGSRFRHERKNLYTICYVRITSLKNRSVYISFPTPVQPIIIDILILASIWPRKSSSWSPSRHTLPLKSNSLLNYYLAQGHNKICESTSIYGTIFYRFFPPEFAFLFRCVGAHFKNCAQYAFTVISLLKSFIYKLSIMYFKISKSTHFPTVSSYFGYLEGVWLAALFYKLKYYVIDDLLIWFIITSPNECYQTNHSSRLSCVNAGKPKGSIHGHTNF